MDEYSFAVLHADVQQWPTVSDSCSSSSMRRSTFDVS